MRLVYIVDMVLEKHETPCGVSMVVPCLTLPGFGTLSEWSKLSDEVCLIMKSHTTKLEIESSQNVRIYPQKEPGLSGALNQGITSAKYFYVRRMDSTDRISSDSIKKQVALIEENDFDLVYDLAKNRVFGFALQPFIGKPAGHIVPSWAFIFCNPVIHPGVLGKRSWFINNPYQDVINEDFELWTRTALSTSIYCTGNLDLEYERGVTQKSASVTFNSSDLGILTRNIGNIIKSEFSLEVSDEQLQIWVSAIFSRDKSKKLVNSANFWIFMNLFTRLKSKTLDMPKSVRFYYENYLLIAKLRFIFRTQIHSRYWIKLLFENFGLHEFKILSILLIKRMWLSVFMKLDFVINRSSI